MTIRTIVLAIALLVPISAGAQESADCVAGYDSNGMRVGRVDTIDNLQGVVFFPDQGRLAKLILRNDELVGDTHPPPSAAPRCTLPSAARTCGAARGRTAK